jgi:hypothetical protein
MGYIRLMEYDDYERTEKEYRKADHASEGTGARSHHHDSDLPTEEKVSLFTHENRTLYPAEPVALRG